MSAISVRQMDRFDNELKAWSKRYPENDTNAMSVIDRFLQIAKIIEKSNAYNSEIDVLSALFRSGEPFQLSPTQLMQSVNLTSGAMTALLNRLEKVELICRKNDTNDGRISLAGLTPKGILVIDKMVLQRMKNATVMFDIFDDFEKRQFSQFLKKMYGYLDEQD